MRQRQTQLFFSFAALTAVLTAGCTDATDPRFGDPLEPGAYEPRLSVYADATFWTANDNDVPICWNTTGFTEEKEVAEAAIEAAWGAHTGLEFSFQATCPGSGVQKFLKIDVVAQSPDANGDYPNLGAEGHSAPGMNGTFRSPGENANTTLELRPDHQYHQGRLEYTAVHEIGHALGFRHEQDRPENEGGIYCNTDGTTEEVLYLGPYDHDSVMSYCNKNGNASGNLSQLDIDGARAVYGWPGRATDIAIGDEQQRPWVIGTSGRVFRWSGSMWEVMREGDHLALDVGSDGTVWAIESDHDIYRGLCSTTCTWQQMQGTAEDIGVGSDGTAWVVGTSKRLFRFNGVGWTLMRNGNHKSIDVGPDGQAWAVEEGGDIVEFDGVSWQTRPGGALDVGIGSDGAVFVIGTSQRAFKWSGSDWTLVPGSEDNRRRVSVGPAGQLGVLDDDDRIFVGKRYGWPGGAIDIGIGDDIDHPWVVGTSGRVFRWEDDHFEMMRDGNHLAIDAGLGDVAVAIDSNHGIRQHQGGSWSLLPGLANDVGLGANGSLWVVGTTKRLFRYDGVGWELMHDADHLAVDVDPAGNAWAIRTNNEIWRQDGNSWTKMPGTAIDVGIGLDGNVYVVGVSRNVFRWTGTSWDVVSGSLPDFDRVSGAPEGRVGLVDQDNSIELLD